MPKEKDENGWVKVKAPSTMGNKTAKAEITGTYATKKTAEESSELGFVMTRAQSTKFIKEWNAEFKS